MSESMWQVKSRVNLGRDTTSYLIRKKGRKPVKYASEYLSTASDGMTVKGSLIPANASSTLHYVLK